MEHFQQRCHIHIIFTPIAPAKAGLVPKNANPAIVFMCTLRAMPKLTSAAAKGRAGSSCCQRCLRFWLTAEVASACQHGSRHSHSLSCKSSSCRSNAPG